MDDLKGRYGNATHLQALLPVCECQNVLQYIVPKTLLPSNSICFVTKRLYKMTCFSVTREGEICRKCPDAPLHTMKVRHEGEYKDTEDYEVENEASFHEGANNY